MRAYFADGPLNGQFREIPDRLMTYRVPIVSKLGPGYWEGVFDPLSERIDVKPPPIGLYKRSRETLRTGVVIFIFEGLE